MRNYVKVLGTIQDGGFPQIDCNKACCQNQWLNPKKKFVSSIAVVDESEKKQWIIDASPEIKFQTKLLKEKTNIKDIEGVFLTHAHIGHYTGLMYYGNEAAGSRDLRVYAMPKMKKFLENNGPWNHLLKQRNIKLIKLSKNKTINISTNLKIKPFLVPHREDYSETVGFEIATSEKKLIYIPDIDNWEKWNISITELIKNIDFALVDGTFFSEREIKRDISLIPHPLVKDSLKLFSNLKAVEKNKIIFTHFNHTNPLIDENSKEHEEVLSKGFRIAKEGDNFYL
jgi:pyrroloquinoline quinone biosynthesis protein B